jgi:hypothetical protein
MTSHRQRKGRKSAKRTRARQVSTRSQPSHARPEVDALIVQSVQRWALITVGLIVLFNLAILRSYPFPDALGWGRAVFYTVLGASTVIATLVVTFLGYRLMSMHVVRRPRTLFVIFLPTATIIASAFVILLLAAPR